MSSDKTSKFSLLEPQKHPSMATIWLAAVRTPDPWRIEPGVSAYIRYRTSEPWRIAGVRFGQVGMEDEIASCVLESFECDGRNQLVHEIPCASLWSPLSSRQYAVLSAVPRLLASTYDEAFAWLPGPTIAMPTVRPGGEVALRVRNAGAAAHLVHGAIFFNVARDEGL